MSNRTLIEIYVTFFLVFIIIYLATVKWFEVPRLVEYMSFASSITSIILAVLDIGYSVLSSSSMDKSLGSLTSSIEQLRNTSSSNLELYHQLRDDVKGSSGMFESGIKSVNSKIEGLLGSKEGRLSIQGAGENDAKPQAENKDLLMQLIPFSSVSGALLIYACIKFFKDKKMFTLPDLSKIALSSDEYLYGFLICMTGTGVVSIIAPSRDASTAISSISGEADKALGACLERIEAFKKRPGVTPQTVDTVDNAVKNLKEYLATGALPASLTSDENKEE